MAVPELSGMEEKFEAPMEMTDQNGIGAAEQKLPMDAKAEAAVQQLRQFVEGDMA